VSNCPEGAACFVSLFTCQPAPKPDVVTVGVGGFCGINTADPKVKCAEGLSCESNCPTDAKCLVEALTCQPKPPSFDPCGGKCKEGTSCKDNCPKDAKCIVAIFSCTPD
jgi:hypothetical protein